MTTRARLAIDKTIDLTINNSHQRVRLCARRVGLPPLLIVQGGPALPLLHEVRKFQRMLRFEDDFLVAYWEQRGCGNASKQDALSASLPRQIEDLRAVLKWLHRETQQRSVILGISIGGTITLQSLDRDCDGATAVVAVSPDSRTGGSDAAAYAFLQAEARRTSVRRLRRRVMTLGEPPYLDAAGFQRRASLLADLGTI